MAGRYRLTFNKPAATQLFQTDNGETADGLRIRLEDGMVSFLPVHGDEGGDVVPLEVRHRGGAQAVIDGSMTDDLINALQHEDGPFLTLKRTSGGWLKPEPFVGVEPYKFEPHVRVWDSETKRPKKTKAPKAKRVERASGQPINMSKVLDEVKTAKQMVTNYVPRRGLPPREIREARETVRAFENMVGEFFPQVLQAHTLLDQLVRRAA